MTSRPDSQPLPIGSCDIGRVNDIYIGKLPNVSLQQTRWKIAKRRTSFAFPTFSFIKAKAR